MPPCHSQGPGFHVPFFSKRKSTRESESKVNPTESVSTLAFALGHCKRAFPMDRRWWGAGAVLAKLLHTPAFYNKGILYRSGSDSWKMVGFSALDVTSAETKKPALRPTLIRLWAVFRFPSFPTYMHLHRLFSCSVPFVPYCPSIALRNASTTVSL